MLREIWRTVILLNFASRLRVAQDGKVYLRKRAWHGGPTTIAYQFDHTALQSYEAATGDATQLLLPILLSSIIGILFAPPLWALFGLLMMMCAAWAACAPIRRVKRDRPLLTIKDVPVNDGVQALGIRHVGAVRALAGIVALGGLISSCAVSVYYRDFLDRNVTATLNMLAYMCLGGGVSLFRASLTFDPADERYLAELQEAAAVSEPS